MVGSEPILASLLWFPDVSESANILSGQWKCCHGDGCASPPTLDPDEAVKKVGTASRVGSRTPGGPTDLIGLGCEAGILSDLIG